MICAAMVFVMVMLGGATRLTESGLSMVQWKPLTLLPPMTAADWQAEFANYQLTPEFVKHNSWMTVDDFKGIFWLEYTHRLWGRLIGFVFFLPFVWFWAKGVVRGSLVWKLAGLFALGGAQGALGWFMVASGLVDRPDVSQYRLAAHLCTAFICYGLIIWVALDLFAASRGAPVVDTGDRPLSRISLALAGAVLLVVCSGALVAGLDAGMIYNTFPLMDGQLIPEGLGQLKPWYLNLGENVMTVQFQHRVLAMTLVACIVALFVRSRRVVLGRGARKLVMAVMHMSFLQAALGITTLLLVVPIPVALAHQTGALTLFTLAVCLAHAVRETGGAAEPVLKPAFSPAE
jgi:cytochrome c oxidase assembly protein subunit 15